MENNENFVEETENVEVTTEETTQKMFTQDELNDIVGKAKATARAKAERTVRREYEGLINVLEAGTGKQGITELEEVFKDHYTKRGIQMPKRPSFSEEQTAVLAEHEAKRIIADGDEVEELNRLTNKGIKDMDDMERAIYPHLVKRVEEKRTREALTKIGVTEDEINSKEYQTFRSQFNADVPEETRYALYRKDKPKKEIRTMGSMKQTQSTGPKDYYTPEEIERITMDDLDDPKVWDAVRRSMTGQ
jgi:hypothetical protein